MDDLAEILRNSIVKVVDDHLSTELAVRQHGLTHETYVLWFSIRLPHLIHTL
jgi:hypothetical protein